MSVNEVKRPPPPTPLKIVGTTISSSGIATGRTYSIGSEDHTLGNILRHVLVRGLNGKLGFCGYSVPHPSEEIVQLRVQLIENQIPENDGSNPVDNIVKEGCEIIEKVCGSIREQILMKTVAFSEEENRNFKE